MKTNPLEEETKEIESYFLNWKELYCAPYDKEKASCWTKIGVILMNGTEFESSLFLHQFARNCSDMELKRDLALVRRQEQQQQKRLSCLKPIDETLLEETIGYEQLAVELTAILAQNDTDLNNIKALNFALLEDFDHLYRFSNLLKMDQDTSAEKLVNSQTEIMPGRPTISEHRHPYDSIKKSLNNKKATNFSKLVASIITAAEQQTMNFYMNMAQMYHNDLGRRLYQEIGMIEEQHVSQYESLMDPNPTWLEKWVMHEYCECYLYASMVAQESDDHIKAIYEEHYEMEVAHLKLALKNLAKYENKKAEDVMKDFAFPELLIFGENKDYIRNVIADSIHMTADKDSYISINEIKEDAPFFFYQDIVNKNDKMVPSHNVIEEYINQFGKDYRFEENKHPIPSLRLQTKDNVDVGRKRDKDIK